MWVEVAQVGLSGRVVDNMWVNVDGLMRVRVWSNVGRSRWHMYMSAWCRGVEVAFVGQCRMHGSKLHTWVKFE